MFVEQFSSYFSIQPKQAQRTALTDQLVSELNEKLKGQSSLGAAQQALLDAKSKLEAHRDERIEKALDGYRALRSRQTSYENALSTQQKQLNNFQALSSRYETLSEELSSAMSEYENYAAAHPEEYTVESAERHCLSQRVADLKWEMEKVNQDVSALVEQANRYAQSQGKYADYLEKTGQLGYAAFEYQEQPSYTRENFVASISDLVERMETGVKVSRQRVSTYCEQVGLTPYDFESYMMERHKLSDAYFAAKQRLSELMYADEHAVSSDREQTGTVEPVKRSCDTVEINQDSSRLAEFATYNMRI